MTPIFKGLYAHKLVIPTDESNAIFIKSIFSFFLTKILFFFKSSPFFLISLLEILEYWIIKFLSLIFAFSKEIKFRKFCGIMAPVFILYANLGFNFLYECPALSNLFDIDIFFKFLFEII